MLGRVEVRSEREPKDMVLTRQRTSPRDPDKFPAAQLFLLGKSTATQLHNENQHALITGAALVRVAEPIALTSIFPYAWKLVLQFHVGDKSNASFYAGVLISAFALAESITGMYVVSGHSHVYTILMNLQVLGRTFG